MGRVKNLLIFSTIQVVAIFCLIAEHLVSLTLQVFQELIHRHRMGREQFKTPFSVKQITLMCHPTCLHCTNLILLTSYHVQSQIIVCLNSTVFLYHQDIMHLHHLLIHKNHHYLSNNRHLLSDADMNRFLLILPLLPSQVLIITTMIIVRDNKSFCKFKVIIPSIATAMVHSPSLASIVIPMMSPFKSIQQQLEEYMSITSYHMLKILTLKNLVTTLISFSTLLQERPFLDQMGSNYGEKLHQFLSEMELLCTYFNQLGSITRKQLSVFST
mmetsp:Transcript_15331/g.23136  ORF Transcript_15331/g.23136 Transcript_15331/m.23136 type:complete len:271 (-) Transcript_15331:215-1027(-)